MTVVPTQPPVPTSILGLPMYAGALGNGTILPIVVNGVTYQATLNQITSSAQVLQIVGGTGIGVATVGNAATVSLSTPVSAANGGTGAVSLSAAGLVTVSDTNTVTNAMLAQMPTLTFKANVTGGTANAGDVTVAGAQAALGIASPVRSSFQGLSVAWASITTATIAFNELMLQNSSNVPYLATNGSLTLDSTVSGAGGLDTGSPAINTLYYVYIIYNGTTVSAIMSLSVTAPALPTGYTYYSGPLSIVITDGGAHFIGFKQYGRDWQYVVGSNLTNSPPQLWSGTEGTYGSAWASIATIGLSASVFVSKIKIIGVSTSTSACSWFIAPSTNYSATVPTGLGSTVASVQSLLVEMLVEGNTLAVQAQANTAGYVLGFTLNI